MVIRTLFLVISLSFSSFLWAIDIKVNDSRENNFYMDALIWLLDKSEADYRLIHTNHIMSSQVRKVRLVKDGEIDVMYAGTTIDMENELRPIRYPITRGLVGTRLLLINKRYQDEYRKVKTIDDLKLYSGILSFGWPEKEIFEAVGLKQVEQLYNNIFSNINSGSRYYFSRGVLEIYSELLSRKKEIPNVIVEEELLLKYRSAVLFFINPNNNELADIINAGFEKGYADGSYQAFIYNHPMIKASFEKAKLKQRRVIDIPNPFFPKESDAIPSRYWHSD